MPCIFDRSELPERELKRTNYSETVLVRLPMHVGCAFAVDREFFFEIGAYDEGMNIYGYEHYELALRVDKFEITKFLSNST